MFRLFFGGEMMWHIWDIGNLIVSMTIIIIAKEEYICHLMIQNPFLSDPIHISTQCAVCGVCDVVVKEISRGKSKCKKVEHER